jgi:hypothetical protein
MTGMAGTGKSTITYTFCELMDERKMLGASFFCSTQLPDCRDYRKIIPTIAYQLALSSPSFYYQLIHKLYDQVSLLHTSKLQEQFEMLIAQPAGAAWKDLDQPPMNVVIDALDECVGSDSVLAILLNFRNDVRLQGKLKFFITTRPEPRFMKHLKSYSAENKMSQLRLHDIDKDIVEADISHYLNNALQGLNITNFNKKIRLLAEKSGVFFLFAATAVRFICPKTDDVDSDERMNLMLSSCMSEETTKTIDGQYEAILKSVFHKNLIKSEIKERKEIINTVVCAATPLTITGIGALLGLSRQVIAKHVDSLQSILNVDEGQSILMFHASFPEYMINPFRSSADICCNTSEHHTTLSFKCFQLMKDSLKFNICNLESSFICDEDMKGLPEKIQQCIPSHIRYVCCFWAYHLKQGSGDTIELCGKLEQFLLESLLFWIETMNLTKCISLCGPMLLEARQWINVSTQSISVISCTDILCQKETSE